jgi:hypothetical protein
MSIRKFIYPDYGLDKDVVIKAFRKALEISKEIGEPEILFLTPDKNLRTTIFSKVLRNNSVKALEKGKKIPINGSYLIFESFNSNKYRSPKIAIAFYPSRSNLDKIDELCAENLIVVPLTEEDINEWQLTWNPEIIGKGKDEEKELIDEREVKNALLRIINATSSLYHPSDYDLALGYLKFLYENGFIIVPFKIKGFALKNGWTVDSANQLRDLTEKIISGINVRKKTDRIINITLSDLQK